MTSSTGAIRFEPLPKWFDDRILPLIQLDDDDAFTWQFSVVRAAAEDVARAYNEQLGRHAYDITTHSLRRSPPGYLMFAFRDDPAIYVAHFVGRRRAFATWPAIARDRMLDEAKALAAVLGPVVCIDGFAIFDVIPDGVRHVCDENALYSAWSDALNRSDIHLPAVRLPEASPLCIEVVGQEAERLVAAFELSVDRT